MTSGGWYYGTVEPRVCWICNELYPPTGPNQRYCPDCKRKAELAKRQRDPDRYNGYDRASQERNREKIRARAREHYQNNREEVLAYERAYYARQSPEWKKERAAKKYQQHLRRQEKKPDAGTKAREWLKAWVSEK